MRICFFGDSLTLGTGDEHMTGWPARVVRSLEESSVPAGSITFYNLGVRANHSGLIRARWLDEANHRLMGPDECHHDGLPELLVFAFGTADVFRSVELEETVNNAREILDTAKALYPVLLIGPLPAQAAQADEKLSRVTSALAGLAKELDLPFVDVYTPLVAHAAYLASIRENDGVHPGCKGYDILAREIETNPVFRAWIGQYT